MTDYKEAVIGRMVSEQGDPRSGIEVTVYDKDLIADDNLGSCVTDSTGKFRVDFTWADFKAGEPLEEAVVKAGAVRLVPIFLTQLSTIVGASFMLSDPIFQGLALAMISGIIVSTALTLGVIPVLYYMYLKIVGPEKVVDVE